MISIKSDYEIALMKKAGNIVYKTHQYLKPFVKPGITTKELDKLAYDYILSQGATPSFLNYDGFPGTICISVNDEVVHGIPGGRKLKNGDIVKLDIGACWKGYHGDSAWSYACGEVSDDIKYLMEHTEKALYKGLEQVKPGNHIGDIGAAIEAYATEHKLGIVRGNKVSIQCHLANMTYKGIWVATAGSIMVNIIKINMTFLPTHSSLANEKAIKDADSKVAIMLKAITKHVFPNAFR